ncbi:thioredoxin-like protein [Ectocarpus siliculosus]|uniref:Thioredoxin-like protein n=1 Tax=Ectocarpus siliculosus TaxID=2880 RepID=D8LIE0_ECTSI|nr:thioredoxin-like protein [Ectocarpus siliculosus]|eukprot:CBN79979.1 thioredoxin-like protein [Ectocarpus siliculosus]
MKASCALAVVLGLCRGPTAVVSFLPPPATALAGAKSSAPVAAGPLIAASSVAAGGRGSRLAAAREDCKSCMEAELLEEERKAAAKGGGAEGAATRRAALEEYNRREKARNTKIAFGSFLSAVGLFFFQHAAIAPAQANPVVLLRAMETSSAPLATALTNGKPTVVDFYADWCENCKAMAPSMREIEEQFKNQINFVVVDGSAEKNYDLVDAFRVDGIPHLAMVNGNGEVETAIIGAVPKDVVVDDIKALLAGRPLPFKGFDMFEGEDHNIKGQIEIDG